MCDRQVDVLRRAGTGAPKLADEIVRAGNLSQAVRGVARFRALQVFAPPGDWLLEFSPLDGQERPLKPARVTLQLRSCIAGEAVESVGAEDTRWAHIQVDIKCTSCQSGTVSLDPYALGKCIRCDQSAHASCTGATKVPDAGWWVSHPRSPLVHRCLHAPACSPNASAMQEWGARNAKYTIRELNSMNRVGTTSGIPDFVGLQCAKGYQVSN
jgi:hypothetical protein